MVHKPNSLSLNARNECIMSINRGAIFKIDKEQETKSSFFKANQSQKKE